MASGWRKRLVLVVGWILVCGIFIAGLALSVASGSASNLDIGIYLTAANALRHNPHTDIYSLSTLAATHATFGGCATTPGWGYLYQPLFAIMLEPLSLLPCSTATAIWQALTIGVLIACIVWLVRRMGQRHGAGGALMTALLCVVALPVYDGMYYGQVDILVLGICLAAVSLMRRNHPRWAGAVLAAGAFLKYLPALLLVYYLSRRRWGAAIGAAAATAALGLFELMIVGPGLIATSISGGSGDLLSTMSRSMTATAPYAPYILCFLVLGIYGVLCLEVARWGSADDPSGLGLSAGEALAIGAMTFASPVVWYHYITWILPAAIVALDALLLKRARRTSKPWITAHVVLFVLAFVSGQSYIAVFAALFLWLICAKLLLDQVGIKLQFARRTSEGDAITQSSQ